MGLTLSGDLIVLDEEMNPISVGTSAAANTIGLDPVELWKAVGRALVNDRQVHWAFVEAFRRAGWGAYHTEQLGFVTLGMNGRVQTCLVTQRAGTYESERGRAPSRTIATFHTHPTKRILFPSTKTDVPEGRRTGLIMFVLHRRGISAYFPRIDSSQILYRGRWW